MMPMQMLGAMHRLPKPRQIEWAFQVIAHLVR